MLRELHIKNIAVIEETTIEFDNGFQVLTGETGAGKSILIDSINMALGSRGSKELIRTGADFASVDLAFEINNKETLSKLVELDVECEDDTILISRKIYNDGKSRCHINGRLTPLNIVREVGELLLNIHGQNDNQSILSPKNHLAFVDEFGNTSSLFTEYKNQYYIVKRIKNSLNEFNTDQNEKEKLVELLSFQIKEIDDAKLKSGEEEALEERRSFLQNAEEISDSANNAYYALHGSDDSQNGAYDGLLTAIRNLDKAKEYDAGLSAHYDTLSSALADIDDVIHELHSFIDGIDYSERELDEIEARLSLIYNLERKYGKNIDEILAYAENSRTRLMAIESSDERRLELESELKSATADLRKIAQELSDARMKSALLLQEKIMNELADLDMQKMRFSVSVSPSVDADGEIVFTSTGCDNVEFLISANPGENLKPLSKIASGGELSRIMLAIKSVLSDTDKVETLIFDEIDTGVSGRAAQRIAEKMGVLSKKCQLLCITHLAQIAAMADVHFLIEKTSDDETTRTTVTYIDGNTRKAELARIIGGIRITDTTLDAAQEMLDMAKAYKE